MSARILICDDNPVFRKALRRVLEGAEDWEINEAGDGEEALARFQECRPSLVVLDLAMPVRDGLSAARQISALNSGVPLLLYTMHNSPALELEARKSGIHKTLSKTDSGQLIATIREVLGARPASSGVQETVTAVAQMPDPALLAASASTGSGPGAGALLAEVLPLEAEPGMSLSPAAEPGPAGAAPAEKIV
jgi:DNA-binding NarL/FixJ family response regulator